MLSQIALPRRSCPGKLSSGSRNKFGVSSRKHCRGLALTRPQELGNISLSEEEYRFLQTHCKYLSHEYLAFLRDFQLRPREQVSVKFHPDEELDDDAVTGSVDIKIEGSWSETILYEIPILALTSEAYFRFMDTDWNYDGQEELAFEKGMRLLEAGCITSEFGTRRRRDYHTQALVFRGLIKASKAAEGRGLSGKLSGTSNVHLAMRFGIPPVGTVAHEWFMGTAAIFNDYRQATELALSHWVSCFGANLAIALTDTFGTPEFLKSFSRPVQTVKGGVSADEFRKADGSAPTYAELFTGVRQDSGDPTEYAKLMRRYYDEEGIVERKVIVFSDSLNIERCLEYKKMAEDLGFQPTFGVGTFFTNDFVHLQTGTKSVPMNIVIKLSSAAGRPAIKIRYAGSTSIDLSVLLLMTVSDNAGKNTGAKEVVEQVKKDLGYVEREWKEGDETSRWGKEQNA